VPLSLPPTWLLLPSPCFLSSLHYKLRNSVYSGQCQPLRVLATVVLICLVRELSGGPQCPCPQDHRCLLTWDVCVPWLCVPWSCVPWSCVPWSWILGAEGLGGPGCLCSGHRECLGLGQRSAPLIAMGRCVRTVCPVLPEGLLCLHCTLTVTRQDLEWEHLWAWILRRLWPLAGPSRKPPSLNVSSPDNNEKGVILDLEIHTFLLGNK
jgi:hypothetical protein